MDSLLEANCDLIKPLRHGGIYPRNTPVIQIRGFAPLLGPSRKAGPSQNARNTAHVIKKGSYRAP